MKISRNWLSDYIVSSKTDDELVDAFTKLGLECTSYKNNSIDSNIVVGEVVSCIKHPDADRLKVCEVNVSDDEILTIVCGAPNVKKNILVPVAKVGANLVIATLGLFVAVPFMYYLNISPNEQLLMVPLGLILVSMLSLGVGLLLACLNAVNRDIEHFFRFVTRAGFFLSPVMWTIEMVSDCIIP